MIKVKILEWHNKTKEYRSIVIHIFGIPIYTCSYEVQLLKIVKKTTAKNVIKGFNV